MLIHTQLSIPLSEQFQDPLPAVTMTFETPGKLPFASSTVTQIFGGIALDLGWNHCPLQS